MNETKKITESELEEIKTLQSKFQDLRFQFGGLYIEKLTVDEAIKDVTRRENQLQDEWKNLQKQNSDLIDAILKKYGEGSLNIKEGVFIPETSAVKPTP